MSALLFIPYVGSSGSTVVPNLQGAGNWTSIRYVAPDATLAPGAATFGIACLFWPTRIESSVRQVLVSKSDGASGYELAWNGVSLEFSVWDGGGVQRSAAYTYGTPLVAPGANKPVLAVGTYDADGGVNIFVNGDIMQISGPFVGFTAAAANEFTIARESGGADAALNHRIVGVGYITTLPDVAIAHEAFATHFESCRLAGNLVNTDDVLFSSRWTVPDNTPGATWAESGGGTALNRTGGSGGPGIFTNVSPQYL